MPHPLTHRATTEFCRSMARGDVSSTKTTTITTPSSRTQQNRKDSIAMAATTTTTAVSCVLNFSESLLATFLFLFLLLLPLLLPLPLPFLLGRNLLFSGVYAAVLSWRRCCISCDRFKEHDVDGEDLSAGWICGGVEDDYSLFSSSSKMLCIPTLDSTVLCVCVKNMVPQLLLLMMTILATARLGNSSVLVNCAPAVGCPYIY